ncbi:hypothetical protein [Lysobacter sp. Root690]|nr:hypothetical protein [Lysobacter sp. Root690]
MKASPVGMPTHRAGANIGVEVGEVGRRVSIRCLEKATAMP